MIKDAASKPKVLVLAAGTGGHVYPALSVADYLTTQGWQVDWLGTTTGIESRLVPQAGYPLHIMNIKGMRGKRWLTFLPNLWRTLTAIIAAWRLLGKTSPDVVLGMGGYVSGPAGLAAFLRGKPLLIHEQNAIAGLTNRLLKPLASVVMQAFPKAFSDAKVLTVGNPIRVDFINNTNSVIAAVSSVQAAPAQAISTTSNNPINLLVVGGSLGAQTINRALPACVAAIQSQTELQINVWHQCGTALWQETQALYGEKLENITLNAFIDDMPSAFAWADLVICRAGALTVSELAAAGKPAILIPYPYAVDDHQTANANILATVGAATLLPADKLNTAALIAVLLPLINDKNLRESMSVAAKKIAEPNATEMVANQCIEALNGKTK